MTRGARKNLPGPRKVTAGPEADGATSGLVGPVDPPARHARAGHAARRDRPVDARRLTITVALGVLGVMLCAWNVLGATKGEMLPQGTISEVKIEGNGTVAGEKIRAKLLSKPGGPLDARLIDTDIKSLMTTKWFSDVTPYYEKDKRDASGKSYILYFTVKEMPVLKSVEFRGRKGVKLKEIEELTGLKPGGRADSTRTHLAIGQIKRLYEEKGYELAEVKLLKGGKPGDTEVVIAIFEGPKHYVRSIDFKGNVFATDSMLKTKISSRTRLLGVMWGKYNRDALEEDTRKLKEYYQAQGFFEVQVTPVTRNSRTDLGAVDIEFDVSEGTRYKVRNIVFDGNKKIPTAKLREGLSLHSGQPILDSVKEADRKALVNRYNAIGCIDTQIICEPKFTNEPGVVDFVYRIEEGEPYLVGEIKINGNDRTKDKVIRREFAMAGILPGEPLDANRLEIAQNRLKNTQFFQASPEMGKPIDIKIANRRPHDKPYGDLAPIELNGVSRLQGPEEGQSPPAESSPPQTPGPQARYQPTTRRRGLIDLIVSYTDPAEPAENTGARTVTPPAPKADAELARMQGPEIEPAPPAVNVPRVAQGFAPQPAGPVGVSPFANENPFNPPADTPPVAVPIPGTIPGAPGGGAPRQPPVGAGVPPGLDPSIPGLNANDVGPDRQDPFAGRGWADIVTSVEEAPTGRFMMGVGASSYQGLLGNLSIYERNFDIFNIPRSWNDLVSGNAFRGAGQEFRVDLTPGTLINRFQVSLREPYLFDLPIGASGAGYLFNRIYPNWTEGRGGGRFALGRQFGTQTYADVAFRIEDVNFYGYTSPAPADYLAASGHTTLATIRPSLRFDNRNSPFMTNKGQYLEFSFEQGWGSFTYPKLEAEGRTYFTLGSRPDGSGKRILTLRGHIGATGRDTPVYERFFAGNFASLRGFQYRGVGPYDLGKNVGGIFEALGSVEYQFPWTANDMFHQVVFCDYGTVNSDYNFDNMRVSVGTGLRVLIPAFGPMPLCFDLAFPVLKTGNDKVQYFNFSIGASY